MSLNNQRLPQVSNRYGGRESVQQVASQQMPERTGIRSLSDLTGLTNKLDNLLQVPDYQNKLSPGSKISNRSKQSMSQNSHQQSPLQVYQDSPYVQAKTKVSKYIKRQTYLNERRDVGIYKMNPWPKTFKPDPLMEEKKPPDMQEHQYHSLRKLNIAIKLAQNPKDNKKLNAFNGKITMDRNDVKLQNLFKQMLFNCPALGYKKDDRLHPSLKLPRSEIKAFLSERYSSRVINKIFQMFPFPTMCSYDDYIDTIEQFLNLQKKDKLILAYLIHDVDNDGLVSLSDCYEMMFAERHIAKKATYLLLNDSKTLLEEFRRNYEMENPEAQESPKKHDIMFKQSASLVKSLAEKLDVDQPTLIDFVEESQKIVQKPKVKFTQKQLFKIPKVPHQKLSYSGKSHDLSRQKSYGQEANSRNQLLFQELENANSRILSSLDTHVKEVTKFVRDAKIKPEIDLTDAQYAKSLKKKSLNDYMSYVAHKKDESLFEEYLSLAKKLEDGAVSPIVEERQLNLRKEFNNYINEKRFEEKDWFTQEKYQEIQFDTPNGLPEILNDVIYYLSNYVVPPEKEKRQTFYKQQLSQATKQIEQVKPEHQERIMKDAWRYSMTTLTAKMQELDPIIEKKRMYKPLSKEEINHANTSLLFDKKYEDAATGKKKKGNFQMAILDSLQKKAQMMNVHPEEYKSQTIEHESSNGNGQKQQMKVQENSDYMTIQNNKKV